jgi:hypothetical protein
VPDPTYTDWRSVPDEVRKAARPPEKPAQLGLF